MYGRIIALHRDAANVKHTICHELAHFIQINNGIGQLPFATLSEQVSFEQQCETMAYHLHKEWYKNTDHRIFTSYFARENHRFLMQWYGEQLQDDLKLSEDKPILWLK